MPRFLKGTTDHDSDGRMGGSMKGDSTMAKAAKKPAKRKSAAAREQDAALKAEALGMATTVDPQSGMSVANADEVPTAKEVKAARKAATEEQFNAADEKAREAIEQATLSRTVRGF